MLTQLDLISQARLLDDITLCCKRCGLRMAQLLRHETSCGFTELGSIPGKGKIMNVPVFNHKVNMVLGHYLVISRG